MAALEAEPEARDAVRPLVRFPPSQAGRLSALMRNLDSFSLSLSLCVAEIETSAEAVVSPMVKSCKGSPALPLGRREEGRDPEPEAAAPGLVENEGNWDCAATLLALSVRWARSGVFGDLVSTIDIDPERLDAETEPGVCG